MEREAKGSILGPVLCNVLFNSLLEVDMGDGEMVAYADDAVVVVQGNSRKETEEKLEEVAEKLLRWTEFMKLELSLRKTVVMKLKVVKENIDRSQKMTRERWL